MPCIKLNAISRNRVTHEVKINEVSSAESTMNELTTRCATICFMLELKPSWSSHKEWQGPSRPKGQPYLLPIKIQTLASEAIEVTKSIVSSSGRVVTVHYKVKLIMNFSQPWPWCLVGIQNGGERTLTNRSHDLDQPIESLLQCWAI